MVGASLIAGRHCLAISAHLLSATNVPADSSRGAMSSHHRSAKKSDKRKKHKGSRQHVSAHVSETLRRVNDPQAAARHQGLAALHPNQEFIVPPGISNVLPDIHVGPFFVKEGLGEQCVRSFSALPAPRVHRRSAARRFWRYSMLLGSGMDNAHIYKLLPEVGAGVKLDLINANNGLGLGTFCALRSRAWPVQHSSTGAAQRRSQM